MSTIRPHRRLSLTSPTTLSTLPAQEKFDDSPQEGEQVKQAEAKLEKRPLTHSTGSNGAVNRKTVKKVASGADDTQAAQTALETAKDSIVRVMAYLSEDEAETLDNLWMAARRSGTRSSKSDILRASLRFSADHVNELNIILSQQHTNTVSRHRNSKMKRAAD